VLALWGGSDTVLAVGVRLAALALVALLGAVVLGWSGLVPVGAALLGAAYATRLAADDVALDVRAPLLAAGLYLAVELAYWSLEARLRALGERGADLRRLAVVLLLALGSLAVGALLLAVSDLVRTGGLAIDLLGAAAAAGALVLVALLALGPSRAGGR
jgi:hypothetical protein